jgi:hypothetical protein
MNAPAPQDIPPGPVISLAVTADGRAYAGGTQLSVPDGTDPEDAAARAAADRARQAGHAIRAVLLDEDGVSWPLIVTPDGAVYQSAPATAASTPPAPPAPDTDPATVPAWPHIRIALTADGQALINGSPVALPVGVDPRNAAVAAAAGYIRNQGLTRPARATATDPDGTAWPLIIHPSGIATSGGEPARADRPRSIFRRKPSELPRRQRPAEAGPS